MSQSQLISPSLMYPNTFRNDKWFITLSNIPSLESIRDFRMYETFVKSLTIPEYGMGMIDSNMMGFKVRQPIAGIKANTELNPLIIEFKVSEDFKNYANLFLWIQAMRYGRSDIFKSEADMFRLNTIKSINLNILDNEKRTIAIFSFTEAFLESLSSLSLNMGVSEELTFSCTFSYEEIKFVIKDVMNGNCES